MKYQKSKAILAYIFSILGGLVVLCIKNTERNTRIHAAQALTIGISYAVLSVGYNFILIWIPFFDYILLGLYLLATIAGIVKVCTNAEPELPVIGKLAMNLFAKQINGNVSENKEQQVVKAEINEPEKNEQKNEVQENSEQQNN